jgi:hypothetical protein
MSQAWYSDLPESEEDKLYREGIEKIKAGVEEGKSFEEAAALIELMDIKDPPLREAVISDALKVIIAELHFAKKKSLKSLAKKLKVPEKVLFQARQEMLEDLEEAAVEKFRKESGGLGPTGNA